MSSELLVAEGTDPHVIEEHLLSGIDRIEKFVPSRYRDATPTEPQVREWICTLIRLADQLHRPVIRTGPSLVLLGGTGSGKTHQAYGAVIALSRSGAACRWTFATAAEIYARLRPRPRVDGEMEFIRIATSPLLVIDDLGAATATEWTEVVNYRLINHRYEHQLPTLITSNVAPKLLGAAIGERVVSRLAEMAHRHVLEGDDRRRKTT